MKQAFLILICLLPLQLFASDSLLSQIDWEQKEVTTYQLHESFAGQTALQMGYAHYQISNPRIWTEDIRKKYIYEIDIVLSKYPKNKTSWLTNYDTLMCNRILELYRLIPELEQNKRIVWNIVLQTGCDSEADAKEMFHGAVVKYKLHLTNKLKHTLNNVRDIINGKQSFEDSVVFKVFDRNKAWKQVLVVNDWTGSMYQYGAQAVLWHKLNLEQASKPDEVAISHFVFFNDGNLTPDDQKQIGETGGIYHTGTRSVREIGNTMREVMLSGYGGDKPENDLEAVLKGIKESPNCQQVILIADNSSAVRDLALLEQVQIPIKVILCGSGEGKPIHPDYLMIAQKTGGSIHTITQDILTLAKKKEGDVIQIDGVGYQLIDEHFVVVGNE